MAIRLNLHVLVAGVFLISQIVSIESLILPESSCLHRGCNLPLNLSAPCQCQFSCKGVVREGFACCNDYLSVCEAAPTSAPTAIPSSAPTIISSCKNRCGEATWADPLSRSCSCDDECAELNACCADFKAECVDTPPPSSSPTQTPPVLCDNGHFSELDGGLSCNCDINDCESCLFYEGVPIGSCSTCMNNTVLDPWLGTCFPEDLCTNVSLDKSTQGLVCDGERASHGSLVCVGDTSTQKHPCNCHPSSCHACQLRAEDETVSCLQCKDQLYLHNGRCIDDITCEVLWEGTLEGSDDHGRRCVTCVDNTNDCQACDSEGYECVTCMNAKYLHEGVCRTSCPAGTQPRDGVDDTHRECI